MNIQHFIGSSSPVPKALLWSYPLQSLGSFLTFVFFAVIGFSWHGLPKFQRELGAG